MKRIFCLTLVLCLLCGAALAAPLVQVKQQLPEHVTFDGSTFTVDTEASYIDFGSTPITDWSAVAPFLRQLPNLRRCDMFNTPIRGKWVEALAAEFPEVEFGWTIAIGYGDDLHLVRTDATTFSTLHLSNATEHTTDELKVLRFCRELRALDVGHNAMEDISWIPELKNLKVLIVAINRITDISPLAELPELEYLEIFNNYITDLSPLSGMTKLKDLNTGWNNITDWSPIYGLTQLERLWVYNGYHRYDVSPIPSGELMKLKEALPNTYIDNVSEPSAGGWRDHPRFNIIHTYFRDGVYVPFDQ